MNRMFAAAILAVWVAPIAAFAQTASQPVRITISKNDCSRLVQHIPSDGVNYRPGEGVGGRRVAPADLPGSGAAGMEGLLPDVLEIPLTITPFAGKAYATNGLSASESNIGTVRYDIAKNSFTLNGQPMAGADQSALAQACAKKGAK